MRTTWLPDITLVSSHISHLRSGIEILPDSGLVRQPGAWLGPWLVRSQVSGLRSVLASLSSVSGGPGLVGLSQITVYWPTCPPPEIMSVNKTYFRENLREKKMGNKNPSKTFQVRLDDRDGCGEIVDNPHRIHVHG